jgi:cell division protein FtsB
MLHSPHQKREFVGVMRLKLATQREEIQQLSHSNERLSTEIKELRQKDLVRKELLSDLTTELSYSASREVKASENLERLQVQHQQSMEEGIANEITVPSLEHRDKSISFEIDDLQKELDEAAVREALLECEVAEARGERDALVQHLQDQRYTPLAPSLLGPLVPPSSAHPEENIDTVTHQTAVETQQGTVHCPIQ